MHAKITKNMFTELIIIIKNNANPFKSLTSHYYTIHCVSKNKTLDFYRYML